jgi:Lambda phage tail tube protein, TTP
MASSAVAGPGWLLQHSALGAGVYTTITEVKDIKGPAQALDTDEITNQSSPNQYKEFIATLLDGGEVTFQCVLVPGDATQDSVSGLLSWMQARGLQDWQIVPPGTYSSHTMTFSAYVTKWDTAEPVAAHATLDITLRITGPVTTN